MDWGFIAKLIIPLLAGSIKDPKVAAIVGRVGDAVQEASQLPGATGSDKRQHVENIVRDGVAIGNVPGKISIDPEAAIAITRSAFAIVDQAKALIHSVPEITP